MKKFGKYEKMRKNAIMKTYVTSLLCLVLCVSMFFGTSFAWFTSEVNNTNNEIYIGTLDVDLFKQGASDNEWLDLASSDTNKVKLFDGNIRWEPGYTTLETIKIVNKGDLAFNYVLNFTETPKDETATQSVETTTLNIMDVAKFFDVWVYTHTEEKPFIKPASYDVITAADSGWTSVGTLADVLAGDAVLSGAMDVQDVRYPQSTESSAAAEGAESSTNPAINDKTTDGKPSEVTYTIALHMKEEATAEVMGFKLSLNVKLIAYQMASEQDDLNSNYDQMVATEEELKEAVANGGNVVLADDIKLTDTLTVAADKTVILDLNGHTISQKKAQTAAYSMIYNKGTLTINDTADGGKISYEDTTTYDGDNGYTSNTIRNEGVLNVNGGTIENTSSDNVKQYGYPHAIDVYQGSVTNIYGGTVKSANYDAIRMFCNSDTLATTVNIYGGNIINRVTFQNPGSNTAGCGVLNITGGTFTTTGNVTANVRLLNFSTDCRNMKATISGGTFDKGVKTQDNANIGIAQSAWLEIKNNVTVNTVS